MLEDRIIFQAKKNMQNMGFIQIYPDIGVDIPCACCLLNQFLESYIYKSTFKMFSVCPISLEQF